MFFVTDCPVVVRCNVVCNEDPVLNVYEDIHILILCKYCSKLEMNHGSNYVNCFQSMNYSALAPPCRHYLVVTDLANDVDLHQL